MGISKLRHNVFYVATLLALNVTSQRSIYELANLTFGFASVLKFSFVADDHQALIWDIQQMPRAIEDPILAYTAGGEINQIQWSSTQPDWIAICYNSCLEILRV